MQKIFSMSYNVKSISVFERQAKRLLKKYVSLKAELFQLVLALRENPKQGIPIGNNCFKIRIAISSKGRGKSRGARVVTNFVITDDTVYLLTIYDKSEKDDLTNKELTELLKSIPE